MSPNSLGNFNPIDASKVGPPHKFTANAIGLATTIIGTNADASEFAVGERVRLYTSADVPKEDTVFTISTIAVDTPGAGSTTITFSPAAAAATASGDYISKSADLTTLAVPVNYLSLGQARQRLKAINAGLYTDARLNTMTLNDLRHAILLNDDAHFRTG